MVTVIQDELRTSAVSSSYSWWKILLTGALVGLLYWGITILAGRFIVEPLFCRVDINAAACMNSVSIAGNVASVVGAIIGLMTLVGVGALRPIVIAAASATLLWNLALWTEKLPAIEVIGWSVVLYALTYTAFAWVSRYGRSVPVVGAVVIILVAARIILG